jgi:hypothetical protein
MQLRPALFFDEAGHQLKEIVHNPNFGNSLVIRGFLIRNEKDCSLTTFLIAISDCRCGRWSLTPSAKGGPRVVISADGCPNPYPI